MGLWDKLVKAKNYFTGGGAELVVEFASEPQLRKPFNVNLYVRVKESDVEVDRIYLKVKNIEEVEVRVRVPKTQTGRPGEVHRTPVGNSNTKNRTERQSHTIAEQEFILDEGVLLHANQEYDWNTEIVLPIDGVNSYAGKNAKIYWTIQAYLEKSGNDPNSKVIVFDPLYEIT